ncbi:MAG: glycosyltransferase [Micavibrio sp.]
MRILIVAMADSVHTSRWVEQFVDNKDMQFHLFPSTFGNTKKGSRAWKRLPLFLARFSGAGRIALTHLPGRNINTAFHYILDHFFKGKWREYWLKKAIKKLKPDIIHSLEFQHAGYLCLNAKRSMKDFPVWIATNWGSDIYLYSRLKGHEEPIRGILQEADFYSAECVRDYELAKGLGLKATPLPVIPNAGGLKLERLEGLRQKTKASDRKLILIKGYQMVFGRAMTAIKSLESIAAALKEKDIKVCVFSVTPDIEPAIELTALKTGIEIESIPIRTPLTHDEILELHARARAYVGVSISDGISTSMLEAMALGAFPIQTCTSCANEWIEHGKTGFIAQSYDDDKEISRLILQAISDDDLVDRAAEENWKTVSARLAYKDVQATAHEFYERATDLSKTRAKP